ncbi:cysteine dioxygenase [Paenibacillus ginsengarvi]|uniref:Cysteine dioxygenase n=1 Tax=Paenibacillus ginsengarvi TaxID=400777 RepID=A0A3B0CHF9_9BACL|nr:cysteine dioxygenase family protein [Paenibacillus ginsengarvi]RKN84208.1 cysteine dioxygenase [Paenibacillus ginsengarvi]
MLFLERLTEALLKLRQPSLHGLQEALGTLQGTKELIAPYVTEPEHLPYGRNVLFRSAYVEAIVVHIPAYRKTFIHDHGSSIGCAQVMEGSILNSIYTLNDLGETTFASQALVKEGQIVLAPNGQVHQMINPGNRRAVSLHLYTPPLAGTKSFRRDEEYVLDYVI